MYLCKNCMHTCFQSQDLPPLSRVESNVSQAQPSFPSVVQSPDLPPHGEERRLEASPVSRWRESPCAFFDFFGCPNKLKG